MPAPSGPPSRPAETPLRLAQVLIPQAKSKGARLPRWQSIPDGGLILLPSRDVNMPGAAGLGQPKMARPLQQPLAPAGVAPADMNAAATWPSRQPAPKVAVSSPAAGQDDGDDGGLSWGIPPIRWGGGIGYSLRQHSTDEGGKSLGQFLNVNLRGSSYIYAPWLATVSGGLSVASGVTSSESGGADSQESRSTSVSGQGSLGLFPSSRFPFTADIGRSDSRATSTMVTTDYTETRLGLRQSYRAEDGGQFLSASFNHSTVTSRDGQHDTVNALQGSYSLPVGRVNNTFNGSYSVSDRQKTGEGSTLLSVSSSHSMSTQDNFSVQAYSNIVENRLNYSAGGRLSEMTGQYLQLGTSASWQPELEFEEEEENQIELPLTLSGGVNYFGTRTGAESAASQSQQLSGNLSAQYRFSSNLAVNGSGSLSQFVANGGRSQLIGMLGSGVIYTGDPLTFGNFSYNWNTGGNANWQGGSGDTPSNVAIGANASHSLAKNFQVTGTDFLSLSLSQGLATSQSQSSGSASSLSHSLSSSYRFGLGDDFSGSVIGSLSDVIATGPSSQHYKGLNLGFNGFGQINPRSSASLNLSFYWSDQKTRDTSLDGLPRQDMTQRMGLSGSASYSHMRFAGMPGLRYTLLFNADTDLRNERMLGNANGSIEPTRYSVDNRLDYQIGRLDTRASFTVTDTGGKKNALLFFQVTRQIGAY